jgi:molecular chaperone IbpA
MRTYDLAPLFRSTVGFDNMARMLDSLSADTAPAYPPYNIEKTGEDEYRITMAVAGFGENDLEIRTQDNKLVITGRIDKGESTEERTFLHRGIAERAFERQFSLADHVKVVDANLENGLLHVELAREVPEAMKPRTIAIKSSNGKAGKARQIESNAA